MNVTVQDLFDAGVHLGHQLRRKDPRSKKFIFDDRHGISIIDLEQTHACLKSACDFLENLVASGSDVMFVGTKKQAQDAIRESATSCQMPFAANRWMGGALTNFATIKNSLDKYKGFLKMEEDGSLDKLHKKEASAIRREMSRMFRNFEGFMSLNKLPEALLVIDIKTEYIAVAEANRLGIPVIAIVDTNSNPGPISYPIPANDDAVKSIRCIMDALQEAIQNGLNAREARRAANKAAKAPITQAAATPVAAEAENASASTAPSA